MFPIREFKCHACNHVWEEIVFQGDENPKYCALCFCTHLDVIPSVIGGYQGDLGPSSTRPKGAGSRPKK